MHGNIMRKTTFKVMNGGLFISRGRGTHPTRTINSNEIIFVASGILNMFEAKRRFAVHPGQCLFLHSGIKHGGTAPYPPNLSFFWIHFTGKLAASLQINSVSRPKQLSNWFRLYLEEQANPAPDKVQLQLVFELLFRECLKTDIQAAEKPNILAEQAARFIKLQFAEGISTSSLAHQLKCNPDYLGRVFRNEAGMTISEAVISARIEHARKLLQATAMQIKEIITESGFSDAAYFRRCFFKRHGITPGQFRRIYSSYHMNTE